MRILIHDYAGHPFPVQLSRELARRGHSVVHAYASLLLTPRGTLERSESDPPGLEFRSVPMHPGYPKNKYNFVSRLGYERAYGGELSKLASRLHPDVILSGQTPSEPQLTFLRASQRLGIPMITWVQDFYSMAVEKLARRKLPFIGVIAGAWYRRFDAICLRESAAIVAITEDFVPVLATFDVEPARISVIPNWASLEDISPQPRSNDWSLAQGLCDKFVFLYSGTLAMKHNPDLLLVLARRFRDIPSVRVVVVSEGPGADYLSGRKAAERLDNLVLLPFQMFSEMPNVLGSADIVVAILEEEAGVFSVPSKVLTYHAAGKPILGAMPKSNLAARILVQEGSGVCVEPRDTSGFALEAEALFKDEPRRLQMAVKARAYADREFNIIAITDRFEAIFKQVTKE